MKITKAKLREIILEELETLGELSTGDPELDAAIDALNAKCYQEQRDPSKLVQAFRMLHQSGMPGRALLDLVQSYGCGGLDPQVGAPEQMVAELKSNLDQEGRMAKQQLFKAAKYSKEIHDMMRDDMQLESWVQAKITKAADYLSSVKHYLEYEIEQGQSVSAALAENKKS
tara:strand:- start:1418 stop:1930 length:513 start_codon:yes stop_codon:yes gene_type:complete